MVNGAGQAQRLRLIPSVDQVLAHPAMQEARANLPQSVVTTAARLELEALRAAIMREQGDTATIEEVATRAASRAWTIASPSLRPVINATGVIIHTNLGRAPLSKSALEAMERAVGYSNLEYDLEAGERGSRYTHAVSVLRSVTGCEDALVVNNNAAGLVLTLTALASDKEVILSRGQSVEIGGGFRIPDVMKQSGATLVEVGTTNRTYASDYLDAITDNTAALMRVHASNFRIVGFTTTPTVGELASIAHERGLLMLDDVGSGALLDTTRFGLAPEPLVQASLAAGADLVLFSGDKLLGGPQCGLIVGKQPIIARLRKHPLARALRVDKLTLAALEATLLHYLKGEAEQQVPVWRMISLGADELKAKAEEWVAELSRHGVQSRVEPGESAVGGGSLPGETLPTWVVSITPSASEQSGNKPLAPRNEGESQAGRLARLLRSASTPIIARVDRGRVLLDPRTVLPGEEGLLLVEVAAAFAS
jgi:L-seryl-tRNA(Ser) seleniumtransferase